MLENFNFILSHEELWYLQKNLTIKELTIVKNYLECNSNKNKILNTNLNEIIQNCSLKLKYNSKLITKCNHEKIISFSQIEKMTNKKWNHPNLLAFQYLGNIEILKKPKIAIIGSRKPTYYGRKIAYQFAKELSQAGCTVVAGGAIGVDTITNSVGLDYGFSCAIIGSGLNHLYPASNHALFLKMAQSENSVILSEFHPYCLPQKWNFPRRNISIAALSDFVLVIEAVKTSGSLITAHAAIELGNDVGAIPGDILSQNSEGCNELLKNGAYCIQSTKDILEIIKGF